MKIRTTLLLSAVALATFSTNAFATQKKGTKTNRNTKARIETGMRTITEDAARAHVYFLADDLLEGRRAGERGSRIAKRYIESRIREIGLKPLLGDSYEQSLALSNVLAMLPGRKRDEYVVVGAHLDHEGQYADVAGDGIYNGADDNASGVSAVLQIMKAFAASGEQPERTVVFAFWDGEEYGLLGSQYFTDHFSGMAKVKGYLNFDMVGSGTDSKYLMYFFTAAHPRLGEWLKDDINKYKFNTFEPDYRAWENPVGGSDQQSFHLKGVPIVWYHTGGQPHYNQPSDEAPTLNYPKLTDITRASYLTAWHLANETAY